MLAFEMSSIVYLKTVDMAKGTRALVAVCAVCRDAIQRRNPESGLDVPSGICVGDHTELSQDVAFRIHADPLSHNDHLGKTQEVVMRREASCSLDLNVPHTPIFATRSW